MIPQRAAQQTLRRIALQRPAYRYVAPAAIAASQQACTGQKRLAATTTVPEHEARNAILAKQRLNRPVAPHLSIYRPQVTWYLSGLNRITGVALSGTFYLYGLGYLAAPYLGWHLESQVLAASFAAWPLFLQAATKFAVALPFTFHSFNSLRHLTWDTASMITNKQVNQTGWFVVGLTVVSSLALAFL